MSSTEVLSRNTTEGASARAVDMKLEVVEIPVSDVERAAKFYARLGWRQDVTPPGSGVFQFTPPGSGCSVQWGAGRTTAAPGSAQGLWLIVSDLQAALEKLAAAGVAPDEVYHIGANGKADGLGLDPERRTYLSFGSFRDPDGNRWLFQEITTRLPGRIDVAATTFATASDLASAMRRAEAAHGEHEKRLGQGRDANWSDWYAEYMVAEQSGAKLPE
jgi:catechol 2,3-dioxygenase-like lactoylglutathione lyase family enzyme